MAFSYSEDLVNHAEYEGDEDCEVPGELARLLQQEERAILPHEELLKTIVIGGSGTDCLTLVSRNVAVSKSRHRLLFSPNGKDKSIANSPGTSQSSSPSYSA